MEYNVHANYKRLEMKKKKFTGYLILDITFDLKWLDLSK